MEIAAGPFVGRIGDSHASLAAASDHSFAAVGGAADDAVAVAVVAAAVASYGIGLFGDSFEEDFGID